MDADVIVVGAGLAGLVATAELADAGRRVIVLDQEPEASLGGQAFWSLGGLMFVDSPEQRRMRVKDSYELGLQDWLGTAAFDRPEDEWPRRWAEAYVGFCAGEKRAWLHEQGMRWSWRVETPGAARLIAPLVVLVGRRQEKTIWRNLKRLLESRGESEQLARTILNQGR